MNIKEETLQKNDQPMYSFSGAITGNLILLSYPTLFLILVAFLLTPFSAFNSFFEVILLRIMISILAPIVFFPLFIPLFPYQKVNFSPQAIKRSFFNFVFFLISLPLLLIFIYIEFFLINLDPLYKDNVMGVLLALLLLIIPLLTWVYVNLHIKEYIFGKDSSQTLKYFRQVKKQKISSSFANINSLYLNTNNVNSIYFTRRWFIIIGSVLGLPYSGLMLIFFNVSYFVINFVIVLFLDIFIILFLLPVYKQLFKSYNISFNLFFANYQKIFGVEDISKRSFSYGITLLATLWLITISFAAIYQYPQKYIFFFLYLLSIGIFVITIWNNQFKKLIHKEKSINSNIRIHR